LAGALLIGTHPTGMVSKHCGFIEEDRTSSIFVYTHKTTTTTTTTSNHIHDG